MTRVTLRMPAAAARIRPPGHAQKRAMGGCPRPAGVSQVRAITDRVTSAHRAARRLAHVRLDSPGAAFYLAGTGLTAFPERPT